MGAATAEKGLKTMLASRLKPRLERHVLRLRKVLKGKKLEDIAYR